MSNSYQMNLINVVVDSKYGHTGWSSSAENLENKLKDKGITDIKLYHRYKLPGDMSPVSYMIKHALRCFFIDMCTKDWCKEDAFKKWLDFYIEKYITDDSLAKQFKQELMSDIEKKQLEIDDYKKELMSDYKLLLKLNPELPDMKDELDIVSVIDGAIFGFAPDEIKYFCSASRDLDAESNVFKELEKYGIKAEYILAPKTAEMVIDRLKERG